MNLKKVDILRLLKDNNINNYMYSDDIIQVNCPFCRSKSTGEKDDKYHMGIFCESNKYSCLRCKKKGSFSNFFYVVTGKALSKEKGYQNVEENLTHELKNRLKVKKNVKVNKSQSIEIPGIPFNQNLIDEMPLIANFIKKRKFTLETLNRHNARFGGLMGKWAKRMILPIYDDTKPVFFQARDMTNKMKNKYDAPIGSLGDYLYYIRNNSEKTLWVTEGIFDSWRLPHNVVATFGLGMTAKQKIKLLDLKKRHDYNYIVVAYDNKAESYSLKLKYELSTFFDKCGVVFLPSGQDPDTLGEEINKLKIIW